jgi:hypothetical protein
LILHLVILYCFIWLFYIAKRVAPRGNHTEQLDAKVLFPEVQEPTKVSFCFCIVLFLVSYKAKVETWYWMWRLIRYALANSMGIFFVISHAYDWNMWLLLFERVCPIILCLLCIIWSSSILVKFGFHGCLNLFLLFLLMLYNKECMCRHGAWANSENLSH